MKKAFTLIELLVVIAIIAILAAILFPVFAQAKEAAKKTAYISSMKQTGTAAQIYEADVDDVMPLAYGVRPAGTWETGVVTPVPANSILTAPWNDPLRVSGAACFWANSLQPYMKNYQMLEMPGAPTNSVAGEIPNPAVPQYKFGIVMNGYLSGLNATSVVNNSVVPQFWHIQKENFQSRGFSSPALSCPGPIGVQAQACSFDPANTSGNGYYVYDFTYTVWQYGGHRGIVARTDSSTKSLPVGTAVSPAFVGWSGKLLDPYAAVTGPTGTPASLWTCDGTFNGQAGNDGSYWCYFRPDRSQ